MRSHKFSGAISRRKRAAGLGGGTPFMLLQAMLGLQQDAPRGKLYVDPALPDWLPDVTLTDLRLGWRRFDIRFWREGDKTQWEVLKGNRDAVARRNYAGWYASGNRLLTDDDMDISSGSG